MKISRESEKAVDPRARTFAMGRASGLEEAIKLVDKTLHAERAALKKAGEQ